ncbi:MAG: hypothetical protein HZC41_24260 [Chloroflexi bacterium]|nr:hypothetical protein [Chloroflexota bacterium]
MKRFLVLVLCLYVSVIGMAVAGNGLTGEAGVAPLALCILLVMVAMRYATIRRVHPEQA